MDAINISPEVISGEIIHSFLACSENARTVASEVCPNVAVIRVSREAAKGKLEARSVVVFIRIQYYAVNVRIVPA